MVYYIRFKPIVTYLTRNVVYKNFLEHNRNNFFLVLRSLKFLPSVLKPATGYDLGRSFFAAIQAMNEERLAA
jgi:hypothetical protein